MPDDEGDGYTLFERTLAGVAGAAIGLLLGLGVRAYMFAPAGISAADLFGKPLGLLPAVAIMAALTFVFPSLLQGMLREAAREFRWAVRQFWAYFYVLLAVGVIVLVTYLIWRKM
jgi:hypothetical protein